MPLATLLGFDASLEPVTGLDIGQAIWRSPPRGILDLDGPKRYQHFIKSVVDREEVWGLDDDGWAMSGLDDGTPAFCLWPEKEFAAACATREWAGYAPRAISLDDLIEELIPTLSEERVCVAVFSDSSWGGSHPGTAGIRERSQEREIGILRGRGSF